MGGLSINCPLCCNKTFTCRESLQEHLSNVLDNLYCPICNSKSSSVLELITHIGQSGCQPGPSLRHTIIYEDENAEGKKDQNSDETENSETKVYEHEIATSNANTSFSEEHSYEAHVDPNDNNKMYVEFISKQLTKPCLQTRELKLVKENGESRYMIVTQDEGELNAESTIVTKQNVDGTISLTTVKDMNIVTDAVIAESAPPEQPVETYSCNTCKVSFTSVIEHIQNYHTDQEVVVEEPLEEGATGPLPIEYRTVETEDAQVTTDKQAPRRVITDTGDIVEEQSILKADEITQKDTVPLEAIQKRPRKVITIDKNSRVQLTVKQIDKLCNTSDKDKAKAAVEKPGHYHKVTLKEVQTDCGFAIKMYHCLSCEVCVPNIDEFKSYPCKTLKYSCPQCPVAYDNSKSLSAHMKVHKVKADSIVEEPISYECEICGTVFPTNKSLKLHKRMHDPIKSRPIEAPVENSDGSEVNEDKYHCLVCDKMIPEFYRTIHQNSHKTSNVMNCSICNKKFNSLEYLEMHMNVHNMDKVPISQQDESLPYTCLYCNRRFARPHEKVKHERIHTGEKPHSCEICGKSFRVSYCLTLHMRTHTGARPYACPHCGKRFKAHSVYNHHLLTHSEVRAYKCPYCPKAFKTSVQLAGHKNSHTKPFSCQHCNRPFASLYAVRVHTETHSRQNNLKFSCQLCGASYARAFALKDHIKQVHKQEDKSPPRVMATDEDWNPDTDSEGIQELNKDLTQEVSIF
ncbi:unnamed protein product [Chrysodeixis includens]|uniref:C2H2-type domain-containing protein n=1 Tax=Chrysodeixis includens TaxID=689277 RepID=A0A9P0BR72_CHRIL|nr:unnamed protein product [Chrysodeixis includens]